jgi:outer membrane murein-binding lipoprotein Lpp
MSIRLIAKALYQLQQEVERLEREMEAAPYERQAALREALRKARAERDRMGRVLEGSKDTPPARSPR